MRPEHAFQKTAFEFLKRALPGAAVWSVENAVEGDAQSPRVRLIKIKRLERGVLPGQPDISVYTLQPRGLVYVGFECKAPNGVLSDAQLARRDDILRNGGHWFGVRTIEQIEAALLSLGLSLACRTGAMGVAVPIVGKRREASYARLNEPVPDMRAGATELDLRDTGAAAKKPAMARAMSKALRVATFAQRPR